MIMTGILLVHGGWHGPWCWDGVAERLRRRGHQVQAVRLRGHDHPPGRIWHRVHHYVDDEGAAAARFAEPPVLVGHSMGGPWVSRPYGTVDQRTVAVLSRLLRRTDLDPAARCRLLGGLSFELAGEGDPRAAEAAREAVALARDLADPALLALAASAEAWEASWDRQPERRARLAAEIGRIGAELDLAPYRWCAEHIAATAAAAGNDLQGLRGHLQQGLELARAYQMPEPLSVGLCAQAMLAHVAGRFDDAERRYAEACA
jgi:hypothetical protein